MRRRALLLIPFACLRGDSAQEVWQLFSSLASALSGGNATEFLSAFDPAMPGYQQLRNQVTALLRSGEVRSSIELVKNDGDDRSRTVEIDWLLTVKQEDDASASIRREKTVTCKLEKQGRKWKIVKLEPAGFFADR